MITAALLALALLPLPLLGVPGPVPSTGEAPAADPAAAPAAADSAAAAPTTADPTAAAPAAPLTLAALLAHADAHAPAVRVALADAGVADAARLDADPLLPDNPTLGFAIGRRTSAGAAGIDYEITLQQRFEIAGERALRQTAAARALDTARAAIDAARWQVHVEVHHRFVDLLVNAERREQAGHFVALAESVAATTRRQVEAGEVSPLVLLVAEADVAESREASITAEREQQALEAAIAAAIGWPDPRIPPVAGTLPPVRPAPPIEALIDQMNTRHPALRTQAAAVREARAHAALEAREGWPEPTIGLSYGQEAGPGPEADAQIWMVGLSLPIPVARTRAGEQARAAAEIVRRERLGDATAARLRADLVEAASEIDAAAARVALYREAIVPRLQENLDRLRKAHALGEVDVHQVSSTRQRLLQATGRYLDARARYHEATAALEALVGTEVDHVMEAP